MTGIISAVTTNLVIDSFDRYISNCAACGEDHNNLPVKELAAPFLIDFNEYDGMYFCPLTGDSVYVNIANDLTPGPEIDLYLSE